MLLPLQECPATCMLYLKTGRVFNAVPAHYVNDCTLHMCDVVLRACTNFGQAAGYNQHEHGRIFTMQYRF